jgi:phage baseplate assembly protein W
MIVHDIYLRDLDRDLEIKDGDFDIRESDEQHIEHILFANKGEYRQWPIVGVGLTRFLSGPVAPAVIDRLKRTIQLQLRYDNMTPLNLELGDLKNFNVNAERIK